MKKIIFGLLGAVWFILGTAGAEMLPGAFVTTWKTDNPGGNANEIIIPIQGVGYNYNIYWSGIDNSYTGSVLGRTVATTITFPSTGIYLVQITGTFPQIYIGNNANTRQKLLSVEQWGSGAWRSMVSAFHGANNMVINATDIPNLSNVTNMQSMFNGATALVDNGDRMNDWNTSKVTNMLGTFAGWAINFNEEIGSWDTSNVINMQQMFENATSFNQNLNNWDTSKVTNMSYMFRNARNFNGEIGNWNTSKVNNMQLMFYQASKFNQPINTWTGDDGKVHWDVSKVTTMRHMFAAWDAGKETTFNQPLNNRNVSNVTDMLSMFQKNIAFNQDISTRNTSKVTTMSCMFCYSPFNQDIGYWNTSNVVDMNGMFYNTLFNQDIGSWDTSKVTDMQYMFGGIANFNQDIGSWNTSKVTNMSYMFRNAESFNQNISGWNTSKVTNMSSMFKNAKKFNQDISSWNVSSLTNVTDMFLDSKLSIINYDALLSGWNNQLLKTGVSFHGGSSQYCFSQSAHDNLFSGGTHGWILQGDGGKNCIDNFNLSNSSVDENTTLIGTLSAQSLVGGTLTYSLTGGTGSDDNNLFVLNGDQLSFIKAPDYENPQDVGDTPNNNTYSIRIQVQGNEGSIIEKIFIITVKDVNENTGGGGGGGYTLPSSPIKETPVEKNEEKIIIKDLLNPSIGTTCFVPGDRKIIDQGISVSESFKKAHQLLYSYKLTTWRGTSDYRPFDYLTREEAARFMVEFAENVLCRKSSRSYNNNFSDIDNSNPTLLSFIKKAYEYEIFNGHKDGTFRPSDRITNDELTAIMVRLIKNTSLEEPEGDWAQLYRKTLSHYAKVSALNDQGRGNIAEVIYDLYRNNEYELKDVGYIIQ